MKIRNLFLVLILFSALFSSCKSEEKALRYVDNLADSSRIIEQLYQEPLIQKNDVLSIRIFSDAVDDGKTDAMFNIANFGGSATATTQGTSTQGFIVDIEGYIEIPKVGKIKAEGLTKQQLADIIKKRVDTVLDNPTVMVTILGEVGKPGTITVPGEKVNILEAMGLAGDATLYAKKDDVIVLRNVDGTIEHGIVNLNSTDLFKSPYYFLRQNDMVVVNANKYKGRLREQAFATRLGIIFGVLNTFAFLYTLLKN
jgi:polysaccharide biosynthesis/export protein